MKRIAMAFALVALVGGTIAALALRRDQRPQPPQQPPPWAFVVDPPGTKPPVDDGTPLHVPGSSSAFTRTQLRDLHDVPDWHPGDHPPMPDVVAHGSRPGVFACAFCHLPNGLGRPENASLAGLRADYIVQQMADFKSGARKSSEPASLPVNLMIAVAKAATDAEVKAAADYFASLPAKPWIRVIEGATAPKTHAAGWMLVPTEPGATEPIGLRILEMPEDLERTELRDAASGFVAYVPVGSVASGEALVTMGGAGKTIACATCHGLELKGIGAVPSIVGRSPGYVVRQIYDIQRGVRGGARIEPMKAAVARLSDADIVGIAAYLASRAP